MEFHRAAHVSEIGALEVPRNSMESHGTARVNEIGAPQVLWNSMPWNCSCQWKWRIWSSMEFHGIPWNCSFHRNWRTHSSMEFHGTARVSEIGVLQVLWNSKELLVSAKLAHPKFQFLGIPWNCSCHHNWCTPSSMEFPWNSMEFQGTARVIEIGALLVPWNSMEVLVSSKLAHSKFHGFPWSCWCQFLGIPWNLLFVI